MPNKSGSTFWLIGLPSSGKTTIARLISQSLNYIHIDSDEIRKDLTPNPSYSQSERELVYRAIIILCQQLNKIGCNVVVSATANLQKYRIIARDLIPNYYEIYIKCPIEICEKRDVKKLYEKSKKGFVSTVPIMIRGVNDKYVEKNYQTYDVFEEPLTCDLIVDTSNCNIDESFCRIVTFIKEKKKYEFDQ